MAPEEFAQDFWRLDWGSEQPSHVENVPAHSKGVGIK